MNGVNINRLRHAFDPLVIAELQTLAGQFDQVVQFARLPHDDGSLLRSLGHRSSVSATVPEEIPDVSKTPEKRLLIVLNGVFNHHLDIQGLLTSIKPRLNRFCRIVTVAWNPYLRWVYWLAEKLGVRQGAQPVTFLTHESLYNLAALAGFDVVRMRPTGFLPAALGPVASVVNRVLPAVPWIREMAVTSVIVLRPILAETRKPSLTLLIPARNEQGNIGAALERLPDLDGGELEVIFIEGNSTDDTWGEIRRQMASYRGPARIKALQQTGRGKNDAVRLGFREATGDLVTILDADLTMPPEQVGRFYQAWCEGLGDFVNGNRLVYPMENEAMRFLNWLGNLFFARLLSFVLEIRLGDSLCGTKLLHLSDVRRLETWRKNFGEFDPFGDFDILFFAAQSGLGVVEVPIPYRARTYGETNISRFTDGWELLKMSAIGLVRLRMGKKHG